MSQRRMLKVKVNCYLFGTENSCNLQLKIKNNLDLSKNLHILNNNHEPLYIELSILSNVYLR